MRSYSKYKKFILLFHPALTKTSQEKLVLPRLVKLELDIRFAKLSVYS